MTPAWLIFDVSFLAHRAFHVMGELSYEGVKTGVAFGVLRDIVELTDLHNTTQVGFCFDRGRPHRIQIYPDYKRARKRNITEDPEKLEARNHLRKQIIALHNEILPEAGFRNIYSAMGYEADDLIASLCLGKDRDQEVIVIACDSDLYQLLGPTTSIWHPIKKKMLTEDWFRQEYHISPAQWADVKAIAGCNTDGVKGVKGVGETTAVKYLGGHLKSGTIAFDRIALNHDIWTRNLELVKLPYRGTPKLTFNPHKFDRIAFRKVVKSLGITTLRV